MDSAAWVRKQIKDRLSPLGTQVAQVLGVVGGGIYNAPINVDRVNWTDNLYIRVYWRGGMHSWDLPHLTLLLAECSRRLLRVEINPCNPQGLELVFHQRKTRTGHTYERLPEIREILDIVDGWYERQQNVDAMDDVR